MTEDAVKQYIDGSAEPSIIYYGSKMEEYITNYEVAFDEYQSYYKYNEGLKNVADKISQYKQYSIDISKDILEETRERANMELGKIAEANESTKEMAKKTLEDYRTTESKTNSSKLSTPKSIADPEERLNNPPFGNKNTSGIGKLSTPKSIADPDERLSKQPFSNNNTTETSVSAEVSDKDSSPFTAAGKAIKEKYSEVKENINEGIENFKETKEQTEATIDKIEGYIKNPGSFGDEINQKIVDKIFGE